MQHDEGGERKGQERIGGERTGMEMKIPFGFRLSKDKTFVVEDKGEQRILQIIQELKTLGFSLTKIRNVAKEVLKNEK